MFLRCDHYIYLIINVLREGKGRGRERVYFQILFLSFCTNVTIYLLKRLQTKGWDNLCLAMICLVWYSN